MGGRTGRVIVGVVLTFGGIGAMSLGWLVGGIAAVEGAAYFVWAGLVMATLGIVLCLYTAIEGWKQEKKGGVPKVRSSNEWVCRNCASRNKQEAIACRYCGSSQQVTKKRSTTEVGRSGDKFCPNCGGTLPGGAKFCEECGARIGDYIPGSGPRTEE